MNRGDRVAGAVVGSAVGDALGAPFEFSREGTFRARFSDAVAGGEMCGGGGWDLGEATDDRQMAAHVAESLLERGGLDLPDIFARFQRWAADEPKDIGLQTEDVLTNGLPWDLAAAIHFQTTHRAAGNGSLMRATTSAVYFARLGRQTTMDALPGLLAYVDEDHRARYATVLEPGWHPDQATEFNGAVWPCLGSAVWALRTTSGFEQAVRAAIDLGGDTDTVAAVTGGLAGARYGLHAIPERWTTPLPVPLPGSGGCVLRMTDLVELGARLDAAGAVSS